LPPPQHTARSLTTNAIGLRKTGLEDTEPERQHRTTDFGSFVLCRKHCSLSLPLAIVPLKALARGDACHTPRNHAWLRRGAGEQRALVRRLLFPTAAGVKDDFSLFPAGLPDVPSRVVGSTCSNFLRAASAFAPAAKIKNRGRVSVTAGPACSKNSRTVLVPTARKSKSRCRVTAGFR
jgi:hypothetical protein